MYYRYTEGKWEYSKTTGIIYADGKTNIVCIKSVNQDSYSPSTAEIEANIKLIVCAPEMCETLEDCAELLE